MMDELDFTAEHKKKDMSKVSVIRVNGKEFIAMDKMLEIIDNVVKTVVAVECLNADGVFKDDSRVWAVARFGEGMIRGLRMAVETLKGGDKE